LFNLFSNIDVLAKSIQDLVTRITTFTNSLTTTLNALVEKVDNLVETVTDEIEDFVEPMPVVNIKLEDGTVFSNAVISIDEGLLNISVTDGEKTELYVTNLGFIAKV
jgi:hypothetical protein